MAYIKLEDAINHILNHMPYCCTPDFYDGQMDCIGQLKSLPTADVKEVKRGHWIAKENVRISKRGRLIHYHTFKCSVCGKWNGRHKQDFCPKCGAEMVGEEDG